MNMPNNTVAVFVEVGAEKLRYLTGWSFAVSAKGERVEVSLDEIYQRANDTLGGEITDASY
jgi:hypothetical protein